MALQDPVTALRGVGQAKAAMLGKLGIETLEDLVSYFPRQYEDRTGFSAVADLTAGNPACFMARVVSKPRTGYIRKGLNTTSCSAADSSGSVRIVFFNQPWMRDNLIPGETYCFYGAISGDAGYRQVVNPAVEAVDAPPKVTRCIIPVYPLTRGLTSKALQQMIFQVLEQEQLPEYLPADLTAGLLPLRQAYEEVHRPTSPEQLKAARRRLVFEEFFLFALGMQMVRAGREKESCCPCPEPVPQSFYDFLPFRLTGAQQHALDEISADLSSGRPMNRLLQGDVGSGKTMVALGAMLQAVCNGYQTVLMAPTELLAAQHYDTISAFLRPMGIPCALLTGSTPAARRRRILDYIAVGAVKLVIGTHALFTADVDYYNLGLVVIDEQHRFGVRQRAALAAKGTAPHMLVLSATPIPRTLALILYGDLDISVIQELPPGRKPVETFLVNSGYRARLQNFMRKQVSQGRQVYVVCPAVEENDNSGLTSAEAVYARLQTELSDLRVGLVHGKLRPEARSAAMTAFLNHETDILVATTVIEVGVDVKNATLMIVEDADRFGLSQLHQLRGRVGRNAEQSYCVLVSDNQNPETRKRLQALCRTGDGFAISQQDLDLRGPGDFFGQRQSGLPKFKSASLTEDLEVLKEAQNAAAAFLQTAPDPELPQNKRLFRRVRELFSEAGDTFN